MLQYSYETIRTSLAEQIQIGEGSDGLILTKTEKSIINLNKNDKSITQHEIAKNFEIIC